ncbi:MAG: phage tail assembly chaperone [Pseudomonadota bacterium]
MSFREKALRWCWLAAHTLGWRPEEFWRATPSELASALHDPLVASGSTVPSRDLIQSMMERDSNGR